MEGSGAGAAAEDGVTHRDGGGGDGVGREAVAIDGGRDMAPLFGGRKAKAMV